MEGAAAGDQTGRTYESSSLWRERVRVSWGFPEAAKLSRSGKLGECLSSPSQ